jgi:uncharacterized membrane protein YfcA
MEVLVYALVGLTAGVLGSMLGVGGGILMVPAMVYFCRVPFKAAAALSLAVMVPMALTSTIRYFCNPEVRPVMIEKVLPALLMATLAIGGAFVGTELSKHLTAGTLKKIFAVIMIAVAVKMFFEKDKAPATNANGGPAAPAAASEETKQL